MTAVLALALVAGAAAGAPVAPGGLPVEPDEKRVSVFSDEVERLLKKKLCPAFAADARLAAEHLAAELEATDPRAATATTLAEAPYRVEERTFAPPSRRSAVEVAASLEAYLAPLAIRGRCSVGFHRFVVAKRPALVAAAGFELLVAGQAADGSRVQDSGHVELELERVGKGGAARWVVTRLALGPRLRVVAPHLRFTEVTNEAGLAASFPERALDLKLDSPNFSSDDLDRGGVAIGDVDGDGDLDLFVVADGPDLLYLAKPDGTYEDVAAKAGVADPGNGRGALLADLDGDGDLDLAVANRSRDGRLGRLNLYENLGGARFRLAATPGGATTRELMHLAAGDVDGDGDLDLHVAIYGKTAGAYPTDLLEDRDGAPDWLLVNEGGFRFEERAQAWGVADRGWTLSSALADLDGDGRPELVAADDFGRKRLYRNDGGKRFVDVSDAAGPGRERANGMGVDIADVDGDGELDLYFANMHSNAGQRLVSGLVGVPGWLKERIDRASQGNTLWRGKGGLSFEEAGEELGVADGGWAYGVMLFDAQNDGGADALSPCGFLTRPDEADL